MSVAGGRHFHEELARLKARLLEMSALAEELVRASVEALRGRDEAAARVSDFTAFFYMGNLVEVDRTDVIFTNPRQERTEAYITGRFG